MYDPTKDYPVLKFAAILLYATGFFIIIMGLVFSYGMYHFTSGVLSYFASDGGLRNLPSTNLASAFTAILIGLFWLSAGLIPIVISQLIEVFLDIRNDVRQMLITERE